MIREDEVFSVYNIHQSAIRSSNKKHPLSDLIGNQETGWPVSRNLLKPLNHLSFLKRKEEIAKLLLLHNTATPQHIFNINYDLLEQHQLRRVSTNEMILNLCQTLNHFSQSLPKEEVVALLREYATIRHMEFHPSDVCNLTCLGCTYGHDNPETKPLPINFPCEHINKITQFQPNSMVIIGGGEPTLYRQGKYHFQELIDEITTQVPDISLALTTNGTFKPDGDWPNKFDWIRLSLDAATASTYTAFRGKPLFDNVVGNFLKYLDYNVHYVGISFLFARQNVHEYASIADFIFRLVKEEKPQHLHKVNIQYRPLRRDPHDYDKPFQEAVNQLQIQTAVKEVRALADSSIEMKKFLREQTNITAILGGNSHPAYEFGRCHYSQTFKIVRANGDIRPCFIRVVEPDFLLGNIINDPLEAIALNTLYVGAIRKPHCNAHGCRQSHVNYVFEQGLLNNIQPSQAPAVLADPMY